MFIDFNCRIFENDKLKSVFAFAPELRILQIESDLEILNRYSINDLVCNFRFDYSQTNCYAFDQIKKYRQLIKDYMPQSYKRAFETIVLPSFSLTSDTPYISDLNKLCANGYILLELPLFPNCEMIDSSLNKILYNCKLLPVFLNFDKCLAMYEESMLDKLSSIKGAGFVFEFASAVDKNILKRIKFISDKNNYVLFSTNSLHNELNERKISDGIRSLQNYLPLPQYQAIIMNARKLIL